MQTLTYTIGKDRRALVKDIQNFTIDFNDQGVKNWVQARQYEHSMRQVFVNVNNDDGPFNLTGCNVWFEGVLPDKTHKILDAKHAVILDAQNGQFRFDMPAQAFAVAGSYVQAFFRIVRDGQSITTLEFDLEVLADKVISGLIPSDYITPFDDLYDQLEQIVNNADGKLQDKLTEWNQKLQNLFDTLNKMGTDTQTLLQTLQNRIAELEEKIKQDGLFTQAEADDFKQSIQQELGKLGDAGAYTEPGNNLVEKIINEAEDRGINVRHFGAIGDGKTDDTDAFQKALDYATAHNRSSVYVPAGEYVITKELTLNFLCLYGEGIVSSVLIPRGSVSRLLTLQWKANLHDLRIDNSQVTDAISDICLAPESGEVSTNCIVRDIYIDDNGEHEVTGILAAPKENGANQTIFSFPNVVDSVAMTNIYNGIHLISSHGGWVNGNVYSNITIQGFRNTGLWLEGGEDQVSIAQNDFENIQVQYSEQTPRSGRAFKISFGSSNNFSNIRTWQDQSGAPIPSMELRPADGHPFGDIVGNTFSGMFESQPDVDITTAKFNDLSKLQLNDWKPSYFNNQLKWANGYVLPDKNVNILPSTLISDYVEGLRSPLQVEGFYQITKLDADQISHYIQFEPSNPKAGTSGTLDLVINRNHDLVTKLSDFTMVVDFDINGEDNQQIPLGIDANYYDMGTSSDSIQAKLQLDNQRITIYPDGTYHYLCHFINQSASGRLCFKIWWGKVKIMRIRHLYLVPGELSTRNKIYESHPARPYEYASDSKITLSNDPRTLIQQLGLYFLHESTNDWFDKNLVKETQRSNGKYVYSYPIYL